MSLVITQRPTLQVIDNLSRFNASVNPIVYKMTRKDYTHTSVDSNGGLARAQLSASLGNLTATFTAGVSCYLYSDDGVYDGVYTVSSSAFGANTSVTFTQAYISTSGAGHVNLESRTAYRVEVELYDTSNDALIFSLLSYSPNARGGVVIDVSTIAAAQLSADNTRSYTVGTALADPDISIGFYIKYREVWTGSANSQVNDTDINTIYAVSAARQVNSTYASNLFEYLISSNMKRTDTDISAAQILAGFATPVTVVPAQGANKVIIPIAFIIRMDFVTAAYATNTTFNFQINGVSVSGTITDVLTAVADQVRILLTPSLTTTTNLVNLPMTWQVLVGAPTAGGGDMKISVLYTVVDML